MTTHQREMLAGGWVRENHNRRSTQTTMRDLKHRRTRRRRRRGLVAWLTETWGGRR